MWVIRAIHKILTGRLAQFPSLRQEGGFSVFPNGRRVLDPFDTAIRAPHLPPWECCGSDMLGDRGRFIAWWRWVPNRGEGWKVEPVRPPETDLIVVLNDNEMSILPM